MEATAAAAATLPLQEEQHEEGDESLLLLDVVIVGAGASGLQCAHTLLEENPEWKVLVLEGRDRIGGRIHSIPYCHDDGNRNEFVYDEGAAWVHGVGFAPPWPSTKKQCDDILSKWTNKKKNPNPMMNLLVDHYYDYDRHDDHHPKKDDCWLMTKLIPIQEGNPWMKPQQVLLDPDNLAMFCNGRQVSHDEMQDGIHRHNAIMVKVRNEVRDDDDDDDDDDEMFLVYSLQDAVDKAKAAIVAAGHFCDQSKQEEEKVVEDPFLVADFFQYMLEAWYASSATRLQAQEFALWKVDRSLPHNLCGDYIGAHCQVTEGMQTILQPLLTDKVKECIRLQEKVVSIRDEHQDKQQQQQKHTICIETASGTMVHTKTCVVTIPVGTLKKEHTKMFVPPLSKRKQETIGDLYMGMYKKVLLEFERITWPSKPKFIALTVTHNDNNDNDDDDAAAADRLPTQQLVIDNLWACRGMPFMEVVLVDDAARWALGKDDDVIRNAVLDFMYDAMGRGDDDDDDDDTNKAMMKNNPCVSCHISRWEESEWSGGAYSSWQLGCRDIEEGWLVEEYGGKLFFAGEGTEGDGGGSVHGALLSGVKVADRVQRFLLRENERE